MAAFHSLHETVQSVGDDVLSSVSDLYESPYNSRFSQDLLDSLVRENAELAARKQVLSVQLNSFSSAALYSLVNPLQEIQSLNSSGKTVRIEKTDSSCLEGLSALAKEGFRVQRLQQYTSAVMEIESQLAVLEEEVNRLKQSQYPDWSHIWSATIGYRNATSAVQKVQKSRPSWVNLSTAATNQIDSLSSSLERLVTSRYRAFLQPLILGVRNPPPDPLAVLSPATRRDFDLAFSAASVFHAAKLPAVSESKQTMWSIEELVGVLGGASCQDLMPRWLERPDLAFALVLRTCKTFVDWAETYLDPLLAKSGLEGFSAREEWVKGFSRIAKDFLSLSFLPWLLENLKSDQNKDRFPHLLLTSVDHAVEFDQQMSALFTGVEPAGGVHPLGFNPSLSAFSDRPEFMALWARVEFEDSQKKLAEYLAKEASWKFPWEGHIWDDDEDADQARFPCARLALDLLWAAVERCRTIPSASHRGRFVRAVAGPLVRLLVDELEARAQETEARDWLAGVSSFAYVAAAIGSCNHCAFVLSEWGDDVAVLEMVEGSPSESFFDPEVDALLQAGRQLAQKVTAAVLRGFDSQFSTFLQVAKSKRIFEGLTLEPVPDPSPEMLTVQAFLSERLAILKGSMNLDTFRGECKSVAAKVDERAFNFLVKGVVRISPGGARQLATDLACLMAAFEVGLTRPSRALKCLDDVVHLMAVSADSVPALIRQLDVSHGMEGEVAFTLEKGKNLRALTPSQALLILKIRLGFMRL